MADPNPVHSIAHIDINKRTKKLGYFLINFLTQLIEKKTPSKQFTKQTKLSVWLSHTSRSYENRKHKLDLFNPLPTNYGL